MKHILCAITAMLLMAACQTSVPTNGAGCGCTDVPTDCNCSTVPRSARAEEREAERANDQVIVE